MSVFNPNRDQVREFFFTVWRKHQHQSVLEPLEELALRIILMHPEYHETLSKPEQYGQQEYFPEQGETNPFLHLSLHLSLLEQISINQPVGIAQIYQQLLQRYQDEMQAQHNMMECLVETIWHAQRYQQGLDSEAYLQRLKNLLDVRAG